MNRRSRPAASQSSTPSLAKRHGGKQPRQLISPNVLFLVLIGGIASIYGLTVYAFYMHENSASPTEGGEQHAIHNQLERDIQQLSLRGAGGKQPAAGQNQNNSLEAPRRYEEWKALAVRLASLPAAFALKELETEDPFGTKHFEASLLAEETRLGRLLEPDELRALFSCPTNSRITLPDQRFLQKAKDFREEKPGTFLFFQHLRKAGGTHFCTLARNNLPTSAVAKYFCMPDMAWSGNKNAGYLHHWSVEEISRRMKEEGQRIAGNEWDWFDVDHHFDLPAVFATSFRKPLDRALSQFRFECIEDRGCKIKDVHEWWDKRKDLYNVYTQTFADSDKRFIILKQLYEDSSTQQDENSAAHKRAAMLGRALDTVAKFNIVLVMEWLAYAGPHVEQVLGFHDTSALTKRVRPHIAQAKRNDGQEENKLGAAGITKASWDPEKYLDPQQYRKMSEHLALDAILTDAARRMFLERLVCKDLQS